MTKRPIWVRMPNGWVEEGRLKELRWAQGEGAASTAALLTWIVLSHHSEPDHGYVQITYDALCQATGLSRPLLSAALKKLDSMGVILRRPDLGRSTYQLADYDRQQGWAMLPAARFYRAGEIPLFAEFKLRGRVELDALKLYLLFISRRDRADNYAHLTYDQIKHYSAVDGVRIRRALSLLTTFGLVHVEQRKSRESEFGISNSYRIVGINSYQHAGTAGRAILDGIEEVTF